MSNYNSIRSFYPQIVITKIRDGHYADDSNDIWIYSERGAPGGEDQKWSVTVRPECAYIFSDLITAGTNVVARNQKLEDALKLAQLLVMIRNAYMMIDVRP